MTKLEIPNLAILYTEKNIFYFFNYKDPVWFDNSSIIQQIKSQVFDMKYIDYCYEAKNCNVTLYNGWTQLSCVASGIRVPMAAHQLPPKSIVTQT